MSLTVFLGQSTFSIALERIVQEQSDQVAKEAGLERNATVKSDDSLDENEDEGINLKTKRKAELEIIKNGVKRFQAGYSIGTNPQRRRRTSSFRDGSSTSRPKSILQSPHEAIVYYEVLRQEIKAMQDYLNELILAARSQGHLFERMAKDDLGANIKDSALNVGVLDGISRSWIDHFADLMDKAVADAGLGLIKDLIGGDRGLSDTLKLKVDRRAGSNTSLCWTIFVSRSRRPFWTLVEFFSSEPSVN